MEVGELHFATKIFKKVINWIIKILKMASERYPRICFLRQLELHKKDDSNIKYNWVSLISKQFFKPLGKETWLMNCEVSKLRNEKENLVMEYSLYLKNIDNYSI